jgi:uncharacterized protein (UPF0332 family)
LDEVDALLNKAYQRLQAAKELFQMRYFDDCVNRAYYSMVSAANAALRFRDITAKTHKGLHIKFSEIYIKSGEIDAKHGRQFRYAEDLRNKVDYDSFETISEEQTEIVLEDAEAFIDSVENLIKSKNSE